MTKLSFASKLFVATTAVTICAMGPAYAGPDPQDGSDGIIQTPEPDVTFPAAPASGRKQLKFEQAVQEKNQWCWAATGVSIARYLGVSISQNDFCKAVKKEDPSTPGVCENRPGRFSEIVAAFDRFGFDAQEGDNLSFDQIAKEIDDNSPVETGILWKTNDPLNPIGGGHAQVIYGYDADAMSINYSDPWGASTRYTTEKFATYEDNPKYRYFASAYDIKRRTPLPSGSAF